MVPCKKAYWDSWYCHNLILLSSLHWQTLCLLSEQTPGADSAHLYHCQWQYHIPFLLHVLIQTTAALNQSVARLFLLTGWWCLVIHYIHHHYLHILECLVTKMFNNVHYYSFSSCMYPSIHPSRWWCQIPPLCLPLTLPGRMSSWGKSL